MKRRTFLQLFGLTVVPGVLMAGRVTAPIEMPRTETPHRTSDRLWNVTSGFIVSSSGWSDWPALRESRTMKVGRNV